jgi:hypothetical protein
MVELLWLERGSRVSGGRGLADHCGVSTTVLKQGPHGRPQGHGEQAQVYDEEKKLVNTILYVDHHEPKIGSYAPMVISREE